MTVDVSSPFSLKRRRLINNVDHILKDVHVFDQSNPEEVTEEFYELTADDYYRILNTQKMREVQETERRSRLTKAVIRVRFPDNNTLEATFHPSDKIQCLVDHLKKVTARPELPFYLFTTPPKKVIKDRSQDFSSAGFVPGAIVHLQYGTPN